MNETRILVLCSSRLALPALQQLLFLNVLVAVVVPRHCDEMAENLQFLLKQTNVPVMITDKASCTADIAAAIEEHRITLGLIITFSFLIAAEVYTLPKQGFYNVHPGPLPQYRGADPVFQQIKNREKQAGVTIHKVNKSFDTGPVVMQEMIRLLPSDTYGLLTSKLGQVAARLLLVLLKLLAFEVAIPLKQQDETKAIYYKRHGAKDVSINWEEMDAATIAALIQACNPWNKGATTMLNGQIIRLLEAEAIPVYPASATVPAATILHFNEGKMLVSTINGGALRIGIVYIDEGFLSGERLPALGMNPGLTFQTIR